MAGPLLSAMVVQEVVKRWSKRWVGLCDVDDDDDRMEVMMMMEEAQQSIIIGQPSRTCKPIQSDGDGNGNGVGRGSSPQSCRQAEACSFGSKQSTRVLDYLCALLIIICRLMILS